MTDKRMDFYELPVNAEYVKTFDNRVYKLIGMVGIEEETGQHESLVNIYYRVRTAVNDSKQIVAKRKNETDELEKVSSKRIIN